jgi:hypothetical protein
MYVAAPRATARAPRSSTCDKQRAAPRAAAWAPRSSTCDAQRAAPRGKRPGRHGHVPATHNEGRRGQRPGHHDQALAQRREQQPRHHDQVTTTHNERRHGQRPRHHGQLPARRRGRRLGHRGQVPAARIERRRVKRPRHNDQVPFVQRVAPRTTAWAARSRSIISFHPPPPRTARERAHSLLVGTGDAGYANAARGNAAADGLAGAWFRAPNGHHRGGCHPPSSPRRRATALPWPFCSSASLGWPAHRRALAACATAWLSSKRV